MWLCMFLNVNDKVRNDTVIVCWLGAFLHIGCRYGESTSVCGVGDGGIAKAQSEVSFCQSLFVMLLNNESLLTS